MNREKLQKVFDDVKASTGMAYAITYPDYYGDCASCVNAQLAIEFGRESKGIWVKWWNYGMNYFGDWTDTKRVFIAHDITAEQASELINALKNNGYSVSPDSYDATKCFEISEIEQ